MLYKTLILPILQLINPEVSHLIAEKFFQLNFHKLFNLFFLRNKSDQIKTDVLGLELNSPIGLAAGYDKNCKILEPLLSLHFGFVTGGTITLQERFGNPKPRLFHIPREKALINSLGFPSLGLDNINQNLKINGDSRIFLSVSGINEDEIISCVKLLENKTKVFEINISSPNTAGLRLFHNPSELSKLIQKIKKISNNKILVKLPPWLESEKQDFLNLGKTAIMAGADGLVVANSLPVNDEKLAVGKGGKSGKILTSNTQRMIAETRSFLGPDPVIVACGGIFNSKDVWNALALGADLCQGYTGFIYEGLFFANNINKGLKKLMDEKNITSLNQIKGKALV
ncbi:MAG: hypothetical protein CL772_05605 [Chloroflexi bacterium]|nr:hypothetical protein [Chloroflexota bacterium]|tara:strand:+ start:15942 stop:16964 length:1023 start_codon:yes stop_codon:yes gene_type:complete